MLKENILSDLKMSSKSVLEHFTVPDDFQNGNTFKGKCMHCGTLISGSYKVTSNFVTHMKRKHRDLYILHSENKEIQPTLTQCIKKSVKYSPSDPKQLEMTNALIMFIAGDLLPLSIVESEEFKNLMEKADTKYQVPSRKHLSSKLLHEKSVEIKNNLVNTLKRAESVCLTIDLWSSRQMRGFLGITGHFILDWATFIRLLTQTFKMLCTHLTIEILEDYKRLQAANATRWNSQLHMICSVLNVPELELDKIDCKTKLSSYERKLLSELCTILEPFDKATVLVQGEKTVTASLPIPVTLGLKHQLKLISVDYNCKMIKSLKSSVEERLFQFVEDEAYILASFLDPRFKTRWCETEQIDQCLAVVKDKLSQVPTSSEPPCDQNSPPCKRAKNDDLFSFMPAPSVERKRNPSGISVSSEMDDYLSDNCIDMSKDPLLYWHSNCQRLPRLAKLAVQYLAIPATSAPVERLFSTAGKTFRPERCRLADGTFEKLMMVKCNGKMLK
ncbi:zinc finger BED domain-containing protein 4-like [Mytilus galloprovincialis]|uniref:zinc finger BED domain-containing protein 4-like n=1 Tax=Mytilus galloprovincialis TaxID=29158 RepID=UPI003F7C1B5C